MLKKINKHKRILVGLLTVFIILFGGLNVYASGSGGSVAEITNPGKWDTVEEFLTALTNFLLQIGLALVVLMIIVGGAFYMFGGVNPELVTKGKNIIMWTVLGVFVLLLSRAIVAIISYAVGG